VSAAPAVVLLLGKLSRASAQPSISR